MAGYYGQPATSDSSYIPQRRHTRRESRQESSRSSEGTVSTVSSGLNSRESMATTGTDVPAWSKKIVVVGDGGCGKTCLLMSYSQRTFPEKYVPTVFENYITTPIHKASGKTIELALWDTAGQEEYDRLRPLSYPETDLLLVCFAIDCPNSLDNIMDKWYPEVVHFCPWQPLILCGLKSDLRHKKTCIDLLKTQGLTPVTPEQGMEVAQKMGAQYMECSSKELIGVDEIFDQAINIVVDADPGTAQPVQASGNSKQQGYQGYQGSQVQPVRRGAPKKKKRSCKML